MSKGIHDDLRKRFLKAHEEGVCLTPCTPSDANRLRRAYRRGDILAPAQQVYALPELWETLGPLRRELHIIRALSKLHPDWIFASASAAIVHGLFVSNRLLGKIHILTDPRTHSRSSQAIERHVIPGITPQVVDNVPVTPLIRTAFDCMRTSDFRASLAIADSTLRLSGMSREELVSGFSKFDCRHRGINSALAVAALADGLSENGGESTARAVMIEQGFMIPSLQVEIPDPVDSKKVFRVDFFWKLGNCNVIGELDGREKYRNPQMTGGRDTVDVLADERLRESHLSGTGAKVMRFSFNDVLDTPRFCKLLTSFGIPKGFDVPPVAQHKTAHG